MKHILLCCCIGLLGIVPVLAQTTSGEITADETWSGTVTVTGDVVVTGGTLTFQPGTQVPYSPAAAQHHQLSRIKNKRL